MRAGYRGVPKVIGVFAAQLDDAYQIGIWRGVERRAGEAGLGVVSFVGHRVNAPDISERAANVAYSLAHPRAVQGLIIFSSAIATYLDQDALVALFRSRGALPQVSVGVKVPGVASVTVDGRLAVRDLARHLVVDHGRRRFAMVDGPPGHPEAVARVRTLCETLDELGVPFEPRLSAPGTFVRASGALGARALLATGLPMDALVCMNDRMALGAMEVLRQSGRRVPEDVAVVGFDGIEEGSYVTPPLTTVVQPLEELGARAVDLLVERMSGRAVEDGTLEALPLRRQSCGCGPRPGHEPSLRRLSPGTPPAEARAVRELVTLARAGRQAPFVDRLDAALTRTALECGNVDRWSRHITVIRNRALEGRGGGRKGSAALFELARMRVGDQQSRLEAARRMSSEERFAQVRLLSSLVAGAFEIPAMLEGLHQGLARLEIGGAYLALFDPPGSATTRARLLMVPQPAAVKLGRDGLRFSTTTLLPSRVGTAWRRGHWVLEPLVFQSESLGFILLPGGAREPAVYETVRDQLASAMKGALLLRQVTTEERRLEQEVARRTTEVTHTNQELTREIERRKRLEREVIEISNRTMQRIGQDLHDDLCQHLAGVAMLVSVLKGQLTATDTERAGSLDKIGDLLEDSIVRAKRIARGLYPAGLAEHGLSAAVEELVVAARLSHPAVIDFRSTPNLWCPDTERALQVYRIVQEALTNSLRHSGSARIDVRLRLDEERRNGDRHSVLTAEVRDYGTGIGERPPARGMGLRIMRYRAELAGADLTVERREQGTHVACVLRLEGGSS